MTPCCAIIVLAGKDNPVQREFSRNARPFLPACWRSSLRAGIRCRSACVQEASEAYAMGMSTCEKRYRTTACWGRNNTVVTGSHFESLCHNARQGDTELNKPRWPESEPRHSITQTTGFLSPYLDRKPLHLIMNEQWSSTSPCILAANRISVMYACVVILPTWASNFVGVLWNSSGYRWRPDLCRLDRQAGRKDGHYTKGGAWSIQQRCVSICIHVYQSNLYDIETIVNLLIK